MVGQRYVMHSTQVRLYKRKQEKYVVNRPWQMPGALRQETRDEE
jgi:hypothetical protein